MKGRTRKRNMRSGKQRGFSLLELLAVMSIMALLTTMAVTSYFNAITGMARRSAVKHIVNTLILARQRACMEGVRVSVMFFNEFHGYTKDEAGNQTSEEVYLPSYVVCKELGRLSYINGSRIGDEFAELDKMFTTEEMNTSYKGQMRLYNLTEGGWWDVKPYVKGDPDFSLTATLPYSSAARGTTVNQDVCGFCFVMVNNRARGTAIGDSYGIEAAPIGSLPKGFVIDGLTDQNSTPICINFLPDGRRDTSTGGASSIKIVETRLPSKRPTNTITVDASGTVTFGENWN